MLTTDANNQLLFTIIDCSVLPTIKQWLFSGNYKEFSGEQFTHITGILVHINFTPVRAVGVEYFQNISSSLNCVLN